MNVGKTATEEKDGYVDPQNAWLDVKVFKICDCKGFVVGIYRLFNL